MAASDCSPARLLCAREDGFYFEASETDVDADSFRISVQHCEHLIRSNDNKFLLLNAAEQFQAEHLTAQQKCQPDCKFNIQIYKDLCLNGKQGRAVMLYANKDGRKMVACCNNKKDIYPKEMVLPLQIEKPADEALFYLKKVPGKTNKYMFESSLYPTEFLGFAPNGHVDKLVLRPVGTDEVDESCEVMFSDCTKMSS